MSNWGGTDAALLKKGIDNMFGDKGRVPLKDDQYKHKVVGCTQMVQVLTLWEIPV